MNDGTMAIGVTGTKVEYIVGDITAFERLRDALDNLLLRHEMHMERNNGPKPDLIQPVKFLLPNGEEAGILLHLDPTEKASQTWQNVLKVHP